MSRSSDFPADIFVAAAGSSVHLLRRRPPAAGGAAAADDFAPVVVGHTCGVNAVRWNRNNKVVASGCADGQVQLLYSSGEVMCVLPRNGATRAADLAAVTALSWSTGSKRLAAGSDNGTVFVFDMSKQNAAPTQLAGHVGGVTAVEYQHEDKFLAVASGGGSVVLYTDAHRAAAGSAAPLPLHPAADTSARLSLALVAAGDASVAAGSAAGSVTVWDAPSQRVREHYAAQHASAPVHALSFIPLRPGLLYSAGGDGRVCLQDRQAGPGRVSALSVGVPVTALMVKEDHSVLGLGTADGVVQLYDPRHTRQPLCTLRLEGGGPVTSLHWQHRFSTLVPSSRQRSSSAAAAAVPPGSARGSHQPVVPSRLGMPPAAAAAGAAAAAPAAAVAPAAAPGAPPAEPAGNAATRGASAAAGSAAAATPAAAIQARLAEGMHQLLPPSSAHGRLAGTAATGGRVLSAPGSRSTSPASVAEAQPRSISQQAAPSQPPPAASQPQVTPLQRQPSQPPALGITPLPGQASLYSSAAAAAAAEVTPQQQLRGALDASQRIQQRAITPLAGSAPAPAASPRRQAEQQAAPTPLDRLAAAPVSLNVTPLVPLPPGGRLAAAPAAASGQRAFTAQRLQVTPLPDPAQDSRSQLCISPLPGMEPADARPGSASPQARSVLGERTNSSLQHAGSGAASVSRHSMLPRLASPLPAAEQPPQVQASPSFAENLPLPSPRGAGRQQSEQPCSSGTQQSAEKIKAAAAAVEEAEVMLGPAASGALGGQWTIAAAPGDAEMADAEEARKQAAAAEFSFAAAQHSSEQLRSGAAWGGGGGGGAAAGDSSAAALPPGLRDDILALHFDMLQQFQAQQASMGQLVAQVLERNEALTGEVAALRKQLAALTGRRDQFLWL